MIKTITITVVMIAAATLFTFASIPLHVLAEVSASGTVGISPVAPPKILNPESELSAIPEPRLPDIAEPELPAIPELSDLPQPELELQ
jgi:hypothetical protein